MYVENTRLLSPESRSRKSGSALLVAIIFSFIAVALLGGYLKLSSNELRLSSRSFLFNSSLNLAEGGVELAIDALNRNDNAGWTVGTDAFGTPYWSRSFTGYNFGGPFDGEISVVVMNPNSTEPSIYAEGLSDGHLGGTLEKQVYVELTSGFSPFRNGFNSKEGIVLKGNNVEMDSYNSNDGPYGFGNVNSEVTVATTSVEVDSVDIGNAVIFGYVATGGAAPDVGPNGAITTHANPNTVDLSRVTTDYYQEFPDVSQPSYPSASSSVPSNGTLAPGDYEISSWSAGGQDTLHIIGDTRIVVDGDMEMTGKASIVVDPNATLTIHVSGDMKLAGNGVLNASNKPGNIMVFGTATVDGEQNIQIAGNGDLSAAVYAPRAHVKLNGNGRVFGAVSAFSAMLVGNSHFSYDEALEDYIIGSGGYQVTEWVEFTGSAIASNSIDMNDYGL